MVARNIAYIVHASLVKKPMNPEKLWPIGKKQAKQPIYMTKELRESIAKKHGITIK